MQRRISASLLGGIYDARQMSAHSEELCLNFDTEVKIAPYEILISTMYFAIFCLRMSDINTWVFLKLDLRLYTSFSLKS